MLLMIHKNFSEENIPSLEKYSHACIFTDFISERPAPQQIFESCDAIVQ